MKIPYRFDFNGDIKHRKVLSSLPDWCTHPMPTAKCRLYYLWNSSEILSQQLNYTPFFTEMVDVKLQETTDIPFVVDDSQVFLFFMISGEVTFQEEHGNPIVVTRNNTFMISVYGSGRFSFKAEPGKHTAFIVNIQKKWLTRMKTVFPSVWNEIEIGMEKHYHALPQHRIGKTVDNWLKSIYEYTETNIGAVDGNQRKYICFILAYYDTRLSKGSFVLAEQLKRFIDSI
jgi:hypothetical protein